MWKTGHAFTLLTFLAVLAPPCDGQQAQMSTTPMRGSADSSFVGSYAFSFTPRNGEPITGELVVKLKGGRFYGVFTSPKLSEPLDADSVKVSGSHLFTSSFGGMYTFAFDLHDTAITNATFTKTLQDVTEEGPLSIKRTRP